MRYCDEFSIEQFKLIYWRKESVVYNDTGKYFQDLLSIEELDFLINSNLNLSSEIEIWKNGKRLDENNFSRATNENYLDSDLAISLYRKGYTLIFNHVHLKLSKIAIIIRNLEKEISSHGHANIYLTPRNAQGFAMHQDGHCVFILQIFGSKIWKVATPDFKEEADIQTFTLHAGQILYIPKGWPHVAHTEDSHSLHITFGFVNITWRDILKTAIEFSDQNHIISDTPVDLLNVSHEQLSDMLLHQIESICNLWVSQNAILQTKSTFSRMMNPIMYGFLADSIYDSTILHDHGNIKLRDGIICILSYESDTLVLEFHRRVVKMPIECKEFILHLINGEVVSVKNIKLQIGELNAKEVIQSLYNEGLIMDANII